MIELLIKAIAIIAAIGIGSILVYAVGRLFGAGFIRSILDHIKRKDKTNGKSKQTQAR